VIQNLTTALSIQNESTQALTVVHEKLATCLAVLRYIIKAISSSSGAYLISGLKSWGGGERG